MGLQGSMKSLNSKGILGFIIKGKAMTEKDDAEFTIAKKAFADAREAFADAREAFADAREIWADAVGEAATSRYGPEVDVEAETDGAEVSSFATDWVKDKEDEWAYANVAWADAREAWADAREVWAVAKAAENKARRAARRAADKSLVEDRCGLDETTALADKAAAAQDKTIEE